MSLKELSKIKEFINDNNREKPNLKMYPRIEDGVLLGISVRFYFPKGYSEGAEKVVFARIEELSKGVLIPNKSDLIWRGVLELNVNYVGQRLDSWSVRQALIFISEDMIKMLLYGAL